MTPVIVLAGIVLGPVVVLTLLRVNATFVFLSLCLGSVLVQFTATGVNSLIGVFSAHVPSNVPIDHASVKLGLLLLPTALTTIIMLRTVHGHGKRLLNLLPSTGVGLLAGLLVIPLLPPPLSHDVGSLALWSQVQQAQSYVVGLSATISLLLLWSYRAKHHHGHSEEKHGKHHKG